jgi:hypothetical protein
MACPHPSQPKRNGALILSHKWKGTSRAGSLNVFAARSEWRVEYR